MRELDVLVTGGAGYIGSQLVAGLLSDGFSVRVLDILMFGDEGLAEVRLHPRLELVCGDLRDDDLVTAAVRGCGAIIHLAGLANDPTADLDPLLTRQVNYEAVKALVDTARRNGIQRFVNASSATVYGVREEDVTESATMEPISLYGQYKAASEAYVLAANSSSFTSVSLRAATVCGRSPRQRLDLTVNILTKQAVLDHLIQVHGGNQMRPNLHILDLIRAYLACLKAPANLVGGEAFNVGFENHTVLELAKTVADTVGGEVVIDVQPVFDHRSYHISSQKIRSRLGFKPRYSIRHAIRGLVDAFNAGAIREPNDSRYYNLAHMQAIGFK